MKKAFITALISFMALSSLKANAICLSGEQVKSNIERQVLIHYRQYTDADLKITVVALPFKDLDLPSGKIHFTVSSNSNKFMPRELEKVNVYVNNRFIKTFNAPIVVKAYEEVLVAATPINRERELDANNVKIEKREVANILDNALRPSDLNKAMVTKKYFVTGELIDKRFVKLKPDVERNSTVTVLFTTNNLTVTIDGTALSSGSQGDEVCIMNKKYNKVYKGTVIGENKVLVKI